MEAPELVITPQEQVPLESEALQQAEDKLRAYLRVLQDGQRRRPTPPKLVFADGRQLELSPSLVRMLQFVLHHMASGKPIAVIPTNKMLTTNQAAEILNVSRPFLVKLLNEGAIEFTKIGTHHRLRMDDVLAYKQRRDRQALDMLDSLAAEAQEAGNYFDE